MVPYDRQYPTRSPAQIERERGRGGTPDAALGAAPDAGLGAEQGSGLQRHIMGLDAAALPIGQDELDALQDGFAVLIIKSGRFPASLQELLSAFAETADQLGGLTRRQVFAVSETAQIAWPVGAAALRRGIRYAITLHRGSDPAAHVLVSTRPPQDSTSAFLQVASWDEAAGHYNFYERTSGTRLWVFEGNSWHALAPPTRGLGPFDSHVNGSLVMKELKAPWLHWHSPAQAIPLTGFAPDSPVQTDPLFQELKGADSFETRIVRPGVDRWTRARLRGVTSAPGGIADPPALLRHLLTTTTVNIVSAQQRSAEDDRDIQVPSSFFLDHDLFAQVLGFSHIPSTVTIERNHYRAAVDAVGLVLRDVDRNGQILFEQAGDAYFAWAVPERAYEDRAVIKMLIANGVLSESFVLALALVDFPNPIDSVRRESLMPLVVPGGRATVPPQRLEADIRTAIAQAAAQSQAAAPVAEAAHLLALAPAALRAEAEARIGLFMDRVEDRAASAEGALDYQRLADSRRRSFHNRRLNEFSMTLPRSPQLMDDPVRELAEDGSVRFRAVASA